MISGKISWHEGKLNKKRGDRRMRGLYVEKGHFLAIAKLL